ncbi:unnamed protein product [Rhodiola kirilowii]
MVGASAGVMTSQAFAVVNGSAPDLPQTASVAGSDCGATIEYSKEAVEALLNETKDKGHGLKDMEQWEQRFDYIRRLRLCIKWFLELEGNYMVEQEKLQTMSQTASVAGSDCGAIQYSKEAVEALLNEKMKKGSSSDLMEQCKERTHYIRRLRRCIEWFLKLEGNYMEEQEKLHAMLNAGERRCDEAELFMKNEEELIAIIMELRKKVAKEESDKLAVTNCLAREKEARVSAEKLQSSLSEEVTKYKGELQASNQKLSSVNEMYKRLQEYNTSVQQYNTVLQSELAAANDNLINHCKTSRVCHI